MRQLMLSLNRWFGRTAHVLSTAAFQFTYDMFR